MYYNALFLNSCNIICHHMAIDFHYFQELTCISRKAISHNYCTAVTVILQFSRSGLPFAFSLIITQAFRANQYVHENSVGYSSANLRDNHPIACSGKPNLSERQSHLGA